MRSLRLLLAGALLTGCPTEDDTTDDTDTDSPTGPFTIQDALSMPPEPTLSIADFESAETCVACHTDHYEEWRTSGHAYAMVDPVFRALVAIRQDDFDGGQDPFCTQCHTVVGTRSHEITPHFDFEQLDPLALEGVTCSTCHQVVDLERPFNSGHVLDPDAPVQGPIEDPQANAFHASAYSELHTESRFCGGCHDVMEVDGLNLERPYEEWTTSPSADDEQTCQDCHMPTREGKAADDGPDRTVHRHRWTGAGIPLDPDFLTAEERLEHEAEVEELLDGAASLTLDAVTAVPQGDLLDVLVTVKNEIRGHNFPTGSTFNRQAWVEITARDAQDTLLFQSGHLDDNGDLRNFYSELDPFGDEDLVTLTSSLTNTFGDPTIFTWRAIEHTSPALSPLYERTFTYFVPTGAAVEGPITIESRLLFRQYGPYALRALGLNDLIDQLKVFEVDTATLTVALEVDAE